MLWTLTQILMYIVLDLVPLHGIVMVMQCYEMLCWFSRHFRVLRTLMYMLFLIHVESCGYYSMSSYEGLALNEWVYNGQGIAYVLIKRLKIASLL